MEGRLAQSSGVLESESAHASWEILRVELKVDLSISFLASGVLVLRTL